MDLVISINDAQHIVHSSDSGKKLKILGKCTVEEILRFVYKGDQFNFSFSLVFTSNCSKVEIGKCLCDVCPLFIQEVQTDQEGLTSVKVQVL